MKARFICDISNARLTRNRMEQCEGFVFKYVVERVVYIARDYFREHLLEDNPNYSCAQAQNISLQERLFSCDYVLLFT